MLYVFDESKSQESHLGIHDSFKIDTDKLDKIVSEWIRNA